MVNMLGLSQIVGIELLTLLSMSNVNLTDIEVLFRAIKYFTSE